MEKTLPVVVVLAVVLSVAGATVPPTQEDNSTVKQAIDDNLSQQLVWKRCAYRVTPTCLKLMLIRLLDRLTEETHFQPLPGILLSSNRSKVLQDSMASPNSDLKDHLDNLLYSKMSGYLNSLTISVHPLELDTTDLVETVTGRKKGGAGMGAIAAMLGGAMMTMMLSALAALAGKALMTSMAALMLSAMGAMKGGGGGGGGGGGKSTHYEIIAQPEISHSHTHSSEIQHGHWKRSLGQREFNAVTKG